MLTTFFLGLYGLVWRGATPFLRRHKRLRHEFSQRLVTGAWLASPVDCWVQAASGGEAYLAGQLVKALAARHSGRPLRVLCTSCTVQGMGILQQLADWLRDHVPHCTLELRYFPLDHPALMRRAVAQASPKVMVLLETELWPGLLAACGAHALPVLVVNGRMREKSLRAYRYLQFFWSSFAPRQVLAISQDDARRFAALFGQAGVSVMPNMKFDGVQTDLERAAVAAGAVLPGWLLPAQSPVLVLGSVRQEEEDSLGAVIPAVRHKLATLGLADACLVVAPRHMERVDAWKLRLAASGCEALLRSACTEGNPVRPGSVIVWDVFGELRALYAAASAVFIGGSLAPLGGQNILEPAAAGVVPCVGASWSNFAWVEQEFFTQGLAVQVPDAEALAETLARQMAAHEAKDSVRKRFAAYLAPRLGGVRQAAEAVAVYLN